MKKKFPSSLRNIAAICTAALLVSAIAAPAMAKSLAEVIAGDHRAPAHKARDKYRHPKETLQFFGLKPEMTVVEIWPGGGGWYQEILAPYLHDHGTYYSAGFDLSLTKGFTHEANEKNFARIKDHPELYGKIIITELAPPEKVTIAPAGSADMVLSFRNFHNWQMGGYDKTVLDAIYTALKPGGIFGITDHRNEMAKKDDGYVRPSYLIKMARDAGFQLVAKSEINANPKDNHNHEKGVWTLPPRLAGDKAGHGRMKAIGESDRLTFKFIKPVQ